MPVSVVRTAVLEDTQESGHAPDVLSHTPDICLQVEEDGNANSGDSQSGSEGSGDSAAQDPEKGKYAPKMTFDDGSVMYAAADLEAADYEAVLSR